MKKKLERMSEINARLREIASTAKKETRELTDAEKDEVRTLDREKTYLELEIRSADMIGREQAATTAATPLLNFMRENRSGNAMTYILREGETGGGQESQTPPATTATNVMKQADVAAGALVPLHVGDIVKPIQEGTIWRQIGIRIPTGLSGSYEWPVVASTLSATYAGEDVALEDQKIDFSKVQTSFQRLGVKASITNQAAFNSEQKLREVILEQIPQAFENAINTMVLSPTQIENCALTGPFVKAAKKTCSTSKTAFANYNGFKADLLSKGYKSDGLVWVMSEAKKAELEATPKDAGSGIMTIEGGRLCGLPVFCNSAMGEKVGLGDFRYQVVGMFGNTSLVVDPVSEADRDRIRFICNMYFGTATLRQDAFMLIS